MKARLDHRILLETLSGKQTRVDGSFRKRPRSVYESYRQGFPVRANDILRYYQYKRQYGQIAKILKRLDPTVEFDTTQRHTIMDRFGQIFYYQAPLLLTKIQKQDL